MKKEMIINALEADLQNWKDAPNGIALGLNRAIKIIKSMDEIPEKKYPDIKIKQVYDYYCPYCKGKLEGENSQCQCSMKKEKKKKR